MALATPRASRRHFSGHASRAHADPDGDDNFADGELAALFKDGFDVVRDEVVETTPDWKKDRAKVQRFVARKR